MDPFPPGAIAQLPGLHGVSYVKTGDAWLLASPRVTTPVWLTDPAPEHDEYRVSYATRASHTSGRDTVVQSIVTVDSELDVDAAFRL